MTALIGIITFQQGGIKKEWWGATWYRPNTVWSKRFDGSQI